MLKKIGVLLGLGTLPIFACGSNMGSVVMLFASYLIPIVMIVWALIQLSKKDTSVEE
jgi:hypothetical protein